jgi:hypothetical protein
MYYLSIDHLTVYVFLLITLVVGLLVGRAIQDIKEYSMANRVLWHRRVDDHLPSYLYRWKHHHRNHRQCFQGWDPPHYSHWCGSSGLYLVDCPMDYPQDDSF